MAEIARRIYSHGAYPWSDLDVEETRDGLSLQFIAGTSDGDMADCTLAHDDVWALRDALTEWLLEAVPTTDVSRETEPAFHVKRPSSSGG